MTERNHPKAFKKGMTYRICENVRSVDIATREGLETGYV
jgi:hypothetical protein